MIQEPDRPAPQTPTADTCQVPRAGQPGFDYEAAFKAERDHRLVMLDKLRDLTAENQALWESVIRFNAQPMRELVGSMKSSLTTLRHDRDEQVKVNRALIEILRENGIDLPSEAKTKRLGEMLGRRDQEVSKAQQGNKTLRRAAREARNTLEKALDPDRWAVQAARVERRTPLETVFRDLLAPAEKAIRILAAGEVAAAGGKAAPRRALEQASAADVEQARVLSEEDLDEVTGEH